jgi:hypothetical protein
MKEIDEVRVYVFSDYVLYIVVLLNFDPHRTRRILKTFFLNKSSLMTEKYPFLLLIENKLFILQRIEIILIGY